MIGWPNLNKTGVPYWPDKEHFHWIVPKINTQELKLAHAQASHIGDNTLPAVVLWGKVEQAWIDAGNPVSPERMAKWADYIGPCQWPEGWEGCASGKRVEP